MALPSETVYTVDDWYDGPLSGVADLGGQPHFYRRTQEDDEAYDRGDCWYELSPVPLNARDLAIEAFRLRQRWQMASSGEPAPALAESAPCVLPEDRSRYAELKVTLDRLLVIDPVHRVRMRGDFARSSAPDQRLSGLKVSWTPV